MVNLASSIKRARRAGVVLAARKRLLTLGIALQVMVMGFFLSQGDPYLQHCLYRYLHAVCPDWRVSEEMKIALQRQIQPVRKITEQGMHTTAYDPQDIINNLEAETNAMQLIFNGPGLLHSAIGPLIGEILTAIVARDYKYLVEDGARPKGEEHYLHHLLQYTSLYNPMKDPYLSHFCYFGILGKGTGIPEFNQMFDEIRQHVTGGSALFENLLLLQSSLARKLPLVIEAYNRKHCDSISLCRGSSSQCLIQVQPRPP
jgi:hypothetical protein